MFSMWISLVTHDTEQFSYPYLPSTYLLWWSICSHLFPFCNCIVFLLHFQSSLYILDTSSLLDMCFVNIFNGSLWLVFSLSSLSEISFHIYVWIYFCILCSVPLTYMSVFTPILQLWLPSLCNKSWNQIMLVIFSTLFFSFPNTLFGLF